MSEPTRPSAPVGGAAAAARAAGPVRPEFPREIAASAVPGG
ncbi:MULTISPECIES: hypothetical protein [unclassified Streptomyces]